MYSTYICCFAFCEFDFTPLHRGPVSSIASDRRGEISYLWFSARYENRNTTIRFRNKRFN